MEDTAYRAIAIVGVGAVMPDAKDAPAFWENVKNGRYSVTEVTPDRWDPALYYDPDHSAPDKTYSKIGGWVREFVWEPMKWRLAIPPRVVDAMDDGQKWAISCTREALQDYGYPERPMDLDRTAVILGNAMGGEKHYLTSLRIYFPEYARELSESATFAALPAAMRRDITRELYQRIAQHLPPITEDSMPGELSNCIAGRIANVFNLHGPNFTVDAACASAMAAMSSAVKGLVERDFDLAITGAIDRNMGATSFVKFSKIGALSATGTRPYADGADGFVMGEGAAIFLLKRLADAERDGDKIYAVLRGIGGSSDGKGKGLTAPNPVGQKFAIERAWQNAGLSPDTVTMIEGHGTSTAVGDVVEAESMAGVLSGSHLRPGSVALGSVKSNIGHLKAGAGAAAFLKVILALRDKVVPPSLNFNRPNPDIDFAHSPLYVNTELRPWQVPGDKVRRAGLSAFGFGGTNFHAVVEEYIPHRLNGNGKRSIAIADIPGPPPQASLCKAPLRGALVIGAASESALAGRLRSVHDSAAAGRAPVPAAPAEPDLRAPERLVIDYSDAADLAGKSAQALDALASNQPAVWKALRARGIFRGHGPAPKVAFLYTGQGSQYVNMLQPLRAAEPIVAETFAEADRVMTPLLGKPLSEFIFVDGADPNAVARVEEDLRQTAITQPAVLATDLALTRLLAAYGIQPDMTMGHSLGEYGALVASGALPFEDALLAVSARGREMTRVSMADNGRMAAVFGPLNEIERILKTVDGYVVIANINSESQSVIGGASDAVERAAKVLLDAGYNVVHLPVSHAFHTSIVAPASGPLRAVLERLHLKSPRIPIVANVNGEFYPMGTGVVPRMLDILGAQVASPVQFVKGLRTLYEAGARVFVEVGPKKALQVFADEVLGGHGDVISIFTNHPKIDDVAAFNQALCGLYAAGLGRPLPGAPVLSREPEKAVVNTASPTGLNGDRYSALGQLFAGVLDRAAEIYHGQNGASSPALPIAITGAALGLPGTERVFDDANVGRILRGDQFIDVIPTRFRRAMLDKNITRLVKSDNGGPTFETIHSTADVIKLAGRAGALDLENEFGVSADRVAALDRVTRLAMGVGLDALRDAGIPLVLRYKTTSKGTQLPDRWGLPDGMRDDTAVILASVWPGADSFAEYMSRYYADHARREQLALLEDLRARDGQCTLSQELDRRIGELRAGIDKDPFVFDRRFLFRILSMGHSQFAEFIGARGPNTQINSACATTTQAVSLAEDWIRAGRCRRVIVISADDVTSDNLIEWMGAGFLASGAAATDEVVEDAATPFDRRRHGMIMGMGAAALVVESAEAARERGIRPICEVLSTVTANSAFHGSRLDVQHIGQMMENLVAGAEQRSGIPRRQLAQKMVFVSHETYTPARGGSASAEIHALRRVFGEDADRIVIANTKGFTGHAMGTGIEDVVAVKALETGLVPPVANFKESDPELGALNLSKGGFHPVEYALRLAAGFGSQISMTLYHWVASADGVRPGPNALGYRYRITDTATWNGWLTRMTGQPAADLEVVHRTLRVRTGVAANPIPTQVYEEVVAKSEDSPAPPPADSVKERILALVVEKTGYPAEMLDPDLDLEADLGVDTVKQAELFAAVREAYNIPREDSVKLRDFPTLAHVIQFVYDHRPELAPASSEPAFIPSHDREEVVVDDIQQKVLDIVAVTTGYPKEMLDLDLDLEADLGIDTVKQAEMFASVRAAFNIPRDSDVKLRDFPTLAHVIKFARDSRSGQPIEPARPVAPSRPALAGFEAANAIPRRVPVPNLRPQLTMCKETGIALSAGTRIVMMPDQGGVGDVLARLLRSIGVEVLLVDGAPDADALANLLQQWLSEGPVQGVYWLPALDNEGSLDKMDLPAWREALRVRVKLLYTTMRVLYDQVAQPGTFLVSATRLGGQHGYDDAGAVAPLGGAVTGFTKTYKWERIDALVKAVDFEAECQPAEVAETLLGETLRDPGAVEIGYKDGLRWTVGLQEQPAVDGRPGLTLDKDTVFVITGAAGSIVSAITSDLAAASGGNFYLLDLAPEPDPANPDLRRFRTDKEGLKRDLFARMQGRGERATPALVEKEMVSLERAQAAQTAIDAIRAAGGKAHYCEVNLADAEGVSKVIHDIRRGSGRIDVLLHAAGIERSHFLSAKDPREFDLVFDVKSDGWFNLLHAIGEMASLERAQAAQTAIDNIRAAGGTAHYYEVNLLDAEAVSKVIHDVRRRSGRIDVLLHAAGIERSHFLSGKDPREFDLVFDVKSDGWFNLLHGIGEMPLGATVAFSSIAGRFGNGGQADYSAANDLLCKITSSFRTTRPATRAIVIDWTAWAGIGMASRGSIPKMMEVAGIDMLPPEAGVPLIRRELTAGGFRGELVVAQRLGLLLHEWDANGGLDTIAAGSCAEGPMIGKITGMGLRGGLTIETTLDPTVQPFLYDHRIDGTPVLPGVMSIETFAEAALCMLPGWHVEAVEDVIFLVPFKFYRNEPRTLTVEVVLRPQAGSLLADCRLTGSRRLMNQSEPQETTHVTARVRLTKHQPEPVTGARPNAPSGPIVEAAGIYSVYFHGPAYQVLTRAWQDGNSTVGEMPRDLPAQHCPPDRPLAMAPRLIELCFQTAGLWEMAKRGRMGLPDRVREVRYLRAPDLAEGPLYAVVTPDPDRSAFNAEVVDTAGNRYVTLNGYRTVALEGAVDAEPLKAFQAVV